MLVVARIFLINIKLASPVDTALVEIIQLVEKGKNNHLNDLNFCGLDCGPELF